MGDSSGTENFRDGEDVAVEDEVSADSPEGAAEGPPDEERTDFYYHGIVRRLSHRKNSGVVRTASGRDVRFSYQMVRMSGPVNSPKGLREGMVVGYDLGWTGHGLRVTTIKTYAREDRQREAPPRSDTSMDERGDGGGADRGPDGDTTS